MSKKNKRRKSVKPPTPKRSKLARNCLCSPKRSTYPVNDHSVVCPVRRMFNTTNGRIIADMLFSEKVRGSPRDYVILSGSSLLEFNGTYEVKIDDGAKLRFSGVLLVHKRKLHRFIGKVEASRFWRARIGRVHDPSPSAKTSKAEATDG